MSCKFWYVIFHLVTVAQITNIHDQSTENHRMAVENLPDVKGYATSDVFVKHPTKDLWKM